MTKITLLTRRSPLAMWQTETVRDRLLQQHPELSVVLSAHSTSGDREQRVALQEIGGKDLFAQDLQQRLAPGSAAVHSLKDLSVNNKPGLCLAATLARANPCDALVSRAGTLDQLPRGATIGTASPRRRSQLLAVRPDLDCQLIRGNVGTRLAKLDNGEYDAILLAYCGLERLGLADRVTELLDPQVFIPAIGQAVVGVECLTADTELQQLLTSIHCATTATCVEAERAFNRYLGGDCFSAIAAHATIQNDRIHLHTYVGSLDGKQQLSAQGSGTCAAELGTQLAQELEAQGARELLNQE
jgi:hydroxymethylbilane synthase